jgi:hypothetical protein
MGTHDEETRKFFVNSGVTCVLFPREGRDQQSSIVHRNTTDRIFTHHQKTARPGDSGCPDPGYCLNLRQPRPANRALHSAHPRPVLHCSVELD